MAETRRFKLSAAGRELIKSFESCTLKAYRCPAGILTIGWGHTGSDVTPGLTISQAKADELLERDLSRFETGVNELVTSGINQNQFDALVSFAFNCGLDIDADRVAEGLGDSTLLRMVNANPDDEGIAAEFQKWNRANGQVLAGLSRRRKAEAKLYFS
jgi:lysozyme